MLEGKEIEKKLGDIGEVSVDVDKNLNIKTLVEVDKKISEHITINGKLDFTINGLQLLKEAVKKTDTKWDDKAVATIESIIKSLELLETLTGKKKEEDKKED